MKTSRPIRFPLLLTPSEHRRLARVAQEVGMRRAPLLRLLVKSLDDGDTELVTHLRQKEVANGQEDQTKD